MTFTNLPLVQKIINCTHFHNIMDEDTKNLVDHVRGLIRNARKRAANGLNRIQVLTYFQIGKSIVEYEQNGRQRADYGEKLIVSLSKELSREFGRGFSKSNLEYMRRFYIEYNNNFQIAQTVSGQLQISVNNEIINDSYAFLSWSHYIFLMRIKNSIERQFYEIESLKNDWSLCELKRQFDSSLFERLALSRDKNTIVEMARKGQVVDKPQDLFKEPYVLEFLGLREDKSYSENEIETAIIDKLEQFLLELGKGFLFEARQKRFTFDSDHFFVDLVFYNRMLRCYVLLDLKIGKLSHQDLGQMQMYVNYFDRYVRLKGENPTIGVILCREKNEAVVELTLPKDTNIYPARYQLYLPSKEELRDKLIEWSENH
jgi:predicted nuclease of restriction endonuclease-like (RecB) superfamily